MPERTLSYTVLLVAHFLFCAGLVWGGDPHDILAEPLFLVARSEFQENVGLHGPPVVVIARPTEDGVHALRGSASGHVEYFRIGLRTRSSESILQSFDPMPFPEKLFTECETIGDQVQDDPWILIYWRRNDTADWKVSKCAAGQIPLSVRSLIVASGYELRFGIVAPIFPRSEVKGDRLSGVSAVLGEDGDLVRVVDKNHAVSAFQISLEGDMPEIRKVASSSPSQFRFPLGIDSAERWSNEPGDLLLLTRESKTRILKKYEDLKTVTGSVVLSPQRSQAAVLSGGVVEVGQWNDGLITKLERLDAPRVLGLRWSHDEADLHLITELGLARWSIAMNRCISMEPGEYRFVSSPHLSKSCTGFLVTKREQEGLSPLWLQEAGKPNLLRPYGVKVMSQPVLTCVSPDGHFVAVSCDLRTGIQTFDESVIHVFETTTGHHRGICLSMSPPLIHLRWVKNRLFGLDASGRFRMWKVDPCVAEMIGQ